ncbi:MAG: DUF3810 domain-containing protein [Clostridia bacterium]|nr:DUF3810 domain-containing protein [Clostridia bacterium]
MIFKLKKEADIAEDDRLKEKNAKKLPRFAIAFYIIAAVSAILFAFFLISESFADFFNRYISSVLRAVLAYITNWIPFSLAEMFIILIPAILVFLVIFAVKRYSESWRDVLVYCGTMLSFLALFFGIFTFGFSAAYRGTKLEEKLGLERRDVSSEELYLTASYLADKVNEEAQGVAFTEGGFSIMPYSYDEMNDKLIAAYDEACDEYDFLQRLDSRVKPVMLSELMSYTHITGVYSFFTGEANINVAFPDYTIPYTAAHELAHQRGIAREDEANFMAFLVCIESDDAYIRYSAYLNLYEYVASALHSADAELYREVYASLGKNIKYEMKAYSEFYDKYRESVAADVSETVNNTFLVIQGTEGTKSYGMVVDIAVAYYKTLQ